MRRWLNILFVGAVAACATDVPPPSAPVEPDWDPWATGRACAKAKVACGVGNCAARIRNECSSPLTCELTVQSICRALTGESGEAKGRARETVAGGERGGVLAQVVCNAGEVLTTRAEQLRCE